MKRQFNIPEPPAKNPAEEPWDMSLPLRCITEGGCSGTYLPHSPQGSQKTLSPSRLSGGRDVHLFLYNIPEWSEFFISLCSFCEN